MFNMFTNTFLSSHLPHALLNLFQWDIEHARDVEWRDGIHAFQIDVPCQLGTICSF